MSPEPLQLEVVSTQHGFFERWSIFCTWKWYAA